MKKGMPWRNSPVDLIAFAMRVDEAVNPRSFSPTLPNRSLRILMDDEVSVAIDEGLQSIRHKYERDTMQAWQIIAGAGKARDKATEALVLDIADKYRANRVKA